MTAFKGFSMSGYMRKKAAIQRALVRDREREKIRAEKEITKRQRQAEREVEKIERARLKKIDDAEKQARLEARIEIRLRKQFKIPKDLDPLVQEGEEYRMIEL